VIVDAHFHCWQLARGDYGWLTPALGAIYRDVTIADWRAAAAPCGVEGGVLVQAAPTQAETEFLLAQAQGEARVLGVVGWLDLLAPDASARIARFAAQPKLKALRPMLHDLPEPEWILQAALAPALRAMAEHGLAFDALVRPEHLAPLLTLCRRHPALRVVIDHAGKPDIAGGAWQPWADALARLADESQAVCKLSGLLTEAGPSPAPPSVRPWAATHALGQRLAGARTRRKLRRLVGGNPNRARRPRCRRSRRRARRHRPTHLLFVKRERHAQPPKCNWYFAPSENRHTPVPSAGPVITYSHCAFTPRAPKALAMPRWPLAKRGALPSTSAWMRPKPL
jgi:L-fuconolactonase